MQQLDMVIALPAKKDYFKIYRVRGYRASTDSNFNYEFRVKTANIKEKVLLYDYNNQFTYRQKLLCFDTKEKAMAFRQMYLRTLYQPCAKSRGIRLFKGCSRCCQFRLR